MINRLYALWLADFLFYFGMVVASVSLDWIILACVMGVVGVVFMIKHYKRIAAHKRMRKMWEEYMEEYGNG